MSLLYCGAESRREERESESKEGKEGECKNLRQSRKVPSEHNIFWNFYDIVNI